MTREEAIKYAQKELKTAYERAEKIGHKGKTRYIEVLETVIKALEQEPKTDILDRLKEEITNIEIYGQVDSHTSFIRTGEQVKNMTIEIIDKYRGEE